MRELTESFIRKRNKGEVPGVWRRVFLEEFGGKPPAVKGGIEITDYIADIGKAEQRIEDRFNEFMPTTTTFTVTDHWNQDHHFFTQGETNGIFDKLLKATVRGYRVFIKEGIEGESDEPIIFDGELDIESIERVNRNRITFTVTGWLRDADRYSAGAVSDPGNPPLHNITGIELSNPTGVVGSKHLEIGQIESGSGIPERKSISYCGGEKGYIYQSIGVYQYLTLYEPNRRGSIDVKALYILTNEDKKDCFSVREYSGSLIACGWWEHRSIEENINHLLDAWWGEGVGTRDIQVEETPGGIPHKQFIYFAPFIDSGQKEDINITASKVIDYNDTTKIIKMLVAVEWKYGNNNKMYLVEINTLSQTRTVHNIISGAGNTIWRVAKFIDWKGDWYAVAGSKRTGIIEEEEWWAEAFWKLDLTNYNTSDITYIPHDATLPSHWFNLYSISAIEGATGHTCYAIQQLAQAGMIYTIEIDVFDIETKTWTYVKHHDDAYAYQKATLGIKDNKDVYYFACKEQDVSHLIVETMSYIYYYDFPLTSIVWYYQWVSKVGTAVTNFVWHKRETVFNKTFFRAYDDVNGTTARWLRDPIVELVPHGDNIRYMEGNDLQGSNYTAWKLEGNRWWIQWWIGYNGGAGNVQTEDVLVWGYSGEVGGPHIFKTITSFNYFFCGFVTDKNLRVYPYVYMKTDEIYSTIKEADYSKWSIFDALKYIAEAYLCYIYVPEKHKIRFYFRKKYGGTITLYDYKKNLRMKIWRNWADGIHIENSKYGLSVRRGETFYKSKVFHMDNRLPSESSIGLVADWHYDFLCIDGRRKDFEVDVPFLIEAEPMDKVILYVYDDKNYVWWIKNTIIYEASHAPWPRKSDSLMVNLKLLEIEGGGPIHEIIGERRSGIV